MALTLREQMERDREYAAMGWITPDCMRDMAGKASLYAYGVLKSDPVRAQELMQFAADMLRVSLETEPRI